VTWKDDASEVFERYVMVDLSEQAVVERVDGLLSEYR
jgi:hypothetical protein